jgi:hypothetical protein
MDASRIKSDTDQVASIRQAIVMSAATSTVDTSATPRQ